MQWICYADFAQEYYFPLSFNRIYNIAVGSSGGGINNQQSTYSWVTGVVGCINMDSTTLTKLVTKVKYSGRFYTIIGI